MRVHSLVILGILSIVYLTVTVPLSEKIFKHCNLYQQNIQQQVEILDVESRLLSGKEWGYALFGKKNNMTIDAAMLSLSKAHESYQKAIKFSMYIVWISIIFMLLIIVLYYKGDNFIKALVGCTAAVSLLALYIGIYAPVLEIVAYSKDLEIPLALKLQDILAVTDLGINSGSDLVNPLLKGWIGMEIPELNLESLAGDQKVEMTALFQGNLYYFYQNKSAVGLINVLFNQKNYVVGIALLLFSVIIPIIKLIITVLLTFIQSIRKNKVLMNLVNIIGKWSMADVFVAACFLSFLSFNNMSNQIETESNTLIGLYFFLSYVVFSLLSSTLLWLELKKR